MHEIVLDCPVIAFMSAFNMSVIVLCCPVERQGSMSPTSSSTVCFSGGIAKQVSIAPQTPTNQKVFGLGRPGAKSAPRQASVTQSPGSLGETNSQYGHTCPHCGK